MSANHDSSEIAEWRIPKYKLGNVLSEIKKLRKSCSPRGAAFNTHFFHSNVDVLLGQIRKEDRKTRKELKELKEKIASQTPPKMRIKTKNLNTIAHKRPFKRSAASELPHIDNNMKFRHKIIRNYQKIEDFKVNKSHIEFDTSLYKRCRRYVELLADSIKNSRNDQPIENALSMRTYDKRILKHCKQESLRMKHNRSF